MALQRLRATLVHWLTWLLGVVAILVVAVTFALLVQTQLESGSQGHLLFVAVWMVTTLYLLSVWGDAVDRL